MADLDVLNGATIAFDLDGTLVDSAPDLVGALNLMLAEAGLPAVPLDDGRLMVGHGAKRLIERGFAQAGAPLAAEDIPDRLERFIALYRDRIAELTLPYPGCVEALEGFKARGATLAVCTNKLTDLSNSLLDALDMNRLFAVVVGADEAPAPKPDPSHLLVTIERAGGAPRRAVLVGDTSSDSLAARAAGVPCIVVDFGYAQGGAAQLGADALIGHYEELPMTLARVLASCRTPAESL